MRSHAEFIDFLSLKKAAKRCAEQVRKEVECWPKQFCLGFHIRHVLDTAAPSIGIHTHEDLDEPANRDGRKADEIFYENEKQGLHTLNHVLDSLYYRPLGRPPDDDVALCVRIDFAPQKADRVFGIYRPDGQDLGTLKNRLRTGRKPRICHYASFGLDIEKLRGDNWSVPEDANDLETSAVLFPEQPSGLFDARKALVDDFVCGAQSLCDQLCVNPSMIVYESIVSGLKSLSRYARKSELYGTKTVTLLIRPRDHFLYAGGVTIISPNRLDRSQLSEVVRFIRDRFQELNQGRYLEDTLGGSSVFRHVATFTGMAYTPNRPTDVTRGLADNIAHYLLAEDLRDSQTKKDYTLAFRKIRPGGPISRSVQSFLDIASGFCEERLEGQPLTYGLILGQPFLMQYWHGANPIPAAFSRRDKQSCEEYFKLIDLPKQVHLIAGPAERCVVVPYVQYNPADHNEMPAYILEFADLQELFGENYLGYWQPEFRPYVFFTGRFPWALGAVVGPGSEVRVFARGRLVAFRDGKGWQTYSDPMQQLWLEEEKSISDLSKTQRSALERQIHGLTDCATHLSPLTRPGSHGGLLLHVPFEFSDGDKWATVDKYLERLLDSEPSRVRSGRWLTGKKLIQSGTTVLDHAVLNLVLRAGALDGAIILCGKDCDIKYFGRRLNFPPAADDEDSRVSGTKRAAARAAVSYFGDVGATAVAVSSDGPIRVYRQCSTTGQVYSFTAFGPGGVR